MTSRRIATVSALALIASLPAATPAFAHDAEPTPVTRAGLDPELVQGRGADVAFVEHEAENAVTTGERIGPSREAYTLPAEASGRAAVRSPRPASTSNSRCPAGRMR